MNQKSWSVLISSAIAVLATTNAYPAAFPAASSSEIAPDATLALRIPFPGRKGTGGSRNGEAYAIAPRQGKGLDVIWRDRPLLIWDGAINWVEISDADTGALLWSQEVKPEDRCVAYGGEPLQAGHRYEWKLCNSPGVAIANGVIPFQVLAPEKRDLITAELATIKAAGISPNELALEQAHYFAKQHLWADLLMAAFDPKNDESLSQAKLLIETVAHITRWTDLVRFSGTARPQVASDSVQIQVFSGEGTAAAAAPLQAPYRLTYEYDPDGEDWENPSFRIKIQNNSQQTLFFTLLDFAEGFSVRSLTGKRTIPIKAGQAVWFDDGDPLEGVVPKNLWEQGLTEYRNTYKVIAFTQDFDPSTLAQKPLKDYLAEDHAMLPEIETVDQVLAQAVGQDGDNSTQSPSGSKRLCKTRSLWGKEVTATPQWFASQVALTFIRPKNIIE